MCYLSLLKDFFLLIGVLNQLQIDDLIFRERSLALGQAHRVDDAVTVLVELVDDLGHFFRPRILLLLAPYKLPIQFDARDGAVQRVHLVVLLNTAEAILPPRLLQVGVEVYISCKRFLLELLL